jgi:hypothetical protein
MSSPTIVYVPTGPVNVETSLAKNLGFAVFSCLAFEGLKSTVSYLAPHAVTTTTEAAQSAIAVSAALASSVPFALCVGVTGGAIGTALIISPTARATAARGVRHSVNAVSKAAKAVHSTVSAIGSGIAEGVNVIGKKCPSLLGIAAITYGMYLAYFAAKENKCFS